MINSSAAIFACLHELGIAYDRVDHAPARSMEDLLDAQKSLRATIPKNLFLAPRNKSAFYLCVVRPDAHFRTAELSKQIGSARLSFGPEDQLEALLRTFPGAISPLGLMFDTSRAVSLLIDESLRDLKKIAFHPNDNTCTLSMSAGDFFDRFLPRTEHAPRFIRIVSHGDRDPERAHV